MLCKIGEQRVEQRGCHLGCMQVVRPRLRGRARADQHDVRIGRTVGELQPAGDPGIDGRAGIAGNVGSSLGEMQAQIVAPLRAPSREILQCADRLACMRMTQRRLQERFQQPVRVATDHGVGHHVTGVVPPELGRLLATGEIIGLDQ